MWYSDVWTSTGTPPAAPSSLTATAASTSEIDLAWSETSTNVAQFKIERSTDGVNFTQITTAAAGVTTYKDTGLAASTTYYYRVRASNTVGNSAYSNVASDITSVPSAPALLTAPAVSTSEIDLAWSESSTNVAQFKIERSTDNVNFTQITTVAAGVITYKNTGLTASTTYYYRVRANNSAGDSAYSNVASDSTSVPAAPSNLTATAVSGSEIDLAWSESSTVAQFKIERSADHVNLTQLRTEP